MKRFFPLALFTLLVTAVLPVFGQVNNTELADPNPGDQSCWLRLKSTKVGWGSTDVRYSRSQVADFAANPVLHGWRGERVFAQAVISTPKRLNRVTLKVSDLKSGSNTIPSSCIDKYFVCYVMGDKYNSKDSLLLPDRLDAAEAMSVEANTTRPLWFDIHIPESAKAGTYKGWVVVDFDGRQHKLPLRLEVVDRILPTPDQWTFHLDLWQNPYAVARYFDVPLWSKEHFDRMRPLMTMLAQAGGKVITASIIEHPWNSQTYDPFESMIGKMKQTDGTWKYDYTVFDTWISFAMECGITEQIDCYTLVPWGYKFEYYDCATNSTRHVSCKPGEKEYEDLLLPFLKDFAAHLKAKGWFERTCIAMDERPMDQLRAAWDLVRRADEGFRIEGAVNYSPEVVNMMYDISLGYRHAKLPQEVVVQRRADNLRTTFYTCCNPDRPNTFLSSPLAESAFLGWHALAKGYNGYLRWAYNSWPAQPCQDSRFGTWTGGDTFLVYPEGPSLRWERLTEGIQQFEKMSILFPTLTSSKKDAMEALLKPMSNPHPDASVDFADWVAAGKNFLRSVE